MKNGLAHDLCYGISEDQNGTIWLGTDNGLVNYNGTSFKAYRNKSFSNQYIIDVLPLPNGEKLMATWGNGLRFLNDTIANSTLAKVDAIGKHTRVFKLKDEFIAYNGRNGLYKLGKNKSGYSLKNYTFRIDNEGLTVNLFQSNKQFAYFNVNIFNEQIYLFSYNGQSVFKGVGQLQNDSLISYPFSFLNNDFVYGLQKFGSKMIAWNAKEIIYCNPFGIEKREVHPFSNANLRKYEENEHYKVFVINASENETEEVHIYNKQTKQWFSISANDLMKAPVSDIHLSLNTKTIWISTYGSGLFQLQPSNFLFGKQLVKEKNCLYYLENGSYHYILTGTDISVLDASGNSIFSYPIRDAYRLELDEDKNQVSVLGSPYSEKEKKLPYFKISPLFSQRQDHYKNFIIRFGDNKAQIMKKNQNPDTINFSSHVRSIAQLRIEATDTFNHTIVFATNQGVYFLDTLRYQLVHVIGQKSGLINDNIIGISSNINSLWLCNSQEMINVKKDFTFKVYNYHNEFDDYINDIFVDSAGTVWLATQKGFAVFKKNKYYQFTTSEGFPSSFTNRIDQDKKGNIWLLGNNGITVLNQGLPALVSPPKQLVSAYPNFEDSQSVILKTSDTIFFLVDCINFTKSQVRTEYCINNGIWKVLNTTSLDLTNFGAGDYSVQFRSRFSNSDYTYSRIYQFSKRAPWYLRIWFLILCGITVTIAIVGIALWRLRVLRTKNEKLRTIIYENETLQKKMNEMQQNVAQDFHDELGNKLAGITLISEKLLRNKQTLDPNNNEFIERIHRDSKDLYSGIKDFIWAIDSKNDTCQELVFTLIDFAEELFQSSGIEFIAINNIKDLSIKLPIYWNRQLLLLYKEVMTNAFKHSKANKVELSFSLTDKQFEMAFIDNGIGFEPNSIKRVNGLQNIQRRASKIGGQLIIQSKAGTSVKFISSIFE